MMFLSPVLFTSHVRSAGGAFRSPLTLNMGRRPALRLGYRPVVKYLKHDDANRVTEADMLAFKDHRLKTVSAKTLRDGDLPAIRSVFGWGVDHRKLAKNPADRSGRSRCSNRDLLSRRR